MSDQISKSCQRTLKKIDGAYDARINMGSQKKAQEALDCYRQANPLPKWISQSSDNMSVGYSSCLKPTELELMTPKGGSFYNHLMRQQASANLLQNVCESSDSGNKSTATTTINGSVSTGISPGLASGYLRTCQNPNGLEFGIQCYATRCLEPDSAVLGTQLYMSVQPDKIACERG